MSDKEKILSIEFDDDDKNYLAFSEHLEEDTERKKVSMAREIESLGDTLLDQIKRKKEQQEELKKTHIKYILKRDKSYSRKELEDYEYETVREIHQEIEEKNPPFFKKLFKFLFNL